MIDIKNENLSRRELLKGAGKLAIGTAIVSAGGLTLISKAEAKETPLPWPYKKLDPEEVGKIAYENWYKGFCCYSVASGIILPLREKIGEPYTSFPVESLVWGHGGVVGWGTLCGTMLGASVVTSLICGPGVAKDGEQIANEVIHWYADTELPIYTPKTPKTAAEMIKSKSDSPLCHISVGKWMKKADKGFWTPERKDRCARLSADVAMRTVKLLNDWADGKFKAEHKLPALVYNITSQHNCTECHGSAVPEINTKGNPTK
ncbi:MAG: C-GCAxxG-C-C family protein [Nitrospirae bacterium]|nr:C-GCAxxG-C-C family protein [Nitrospirota bacterium]